LIVLILLPPSETKREGGVEGTTLDLAQLSFPELTKTRRTVIAAVKSLARNGAAMSAALHLGPKLQFEVARNRTLQSSPLLPAVERYTGVIYDAVDAPTLTDEARRFADEHLAIHSALFGLVRAGDPISAYRLSHSSRLPGLPLKKTWRPVISGLLDARHGLILDLRSEGYVEFGPPSPEVDSYFVRVVTVGADGATRALNHFNKKGKGEFVRALLQSAQAHESVESLLEWTTASGIDLERSGARELVLTV
jgi:cytoplasmic iron level regulating protein YaaA (DUF328/UPF0246 family)